jgi:NADPH:quinone reductase-like Zn-dependent oxidoreductase
LVRVADERAWTETGVPAQIAADLAKGNRPYCALAAERGVEFHGPLTRADGAQLAEIAALVDAGSIKPLVSQVFGLDELAKAYDTMASQRTRGTVVIAIKD